MLHYSLKNNEKESMIFLIVEILPLSSEEKRYNLLSTSLDYFFSPLYLAFFPRKILNERS